MTWNPNGPDERPDLHEHRRQLLLVRGYFDDLAGFPADTQANILKRLRELADLTGEPMLTHDQIDALVRERDTARAEADALRASLTEAHATITRIAVACATIDCEDLVAEHTTPDDYENLVEHVERVVEDGHVQHAAAAKSRPLATLLHRIPATEAPFVLAYHPDADPMLDGSGWLCEVDDWSTHAGPLDAVIAAACDRLGVGHG